MLHMPMQPVQWPEVDAGPGALLVSMGEREIKSKIRAALEDNSDLVACRAISSAGSLGQTGGGVAEQIGETTLQEREAVVQTPGLQQDVVHVNHNRDQDCCSNKTGFKHP